MALSTKKRHGFRAFLNKTIHGSSLDDKREETVKKPVLVPTDPTYGQAKNKMISRRAAAEEELEAAATQLNQAMTKVSGKLQVPEPLRLQECKLNDVEGTARILQSAIDDIVSARKEKVSSETRQISRDCVKNWFTAVYPYVSVGLEEVDVCLLIYFLTKGPHSHSLRFRD